MEHWRARFTATFVLAMLAFFIWGGARSGAYSSASSRSEDRLDDAFTVLSRVDSGRQLISRALKRWNFKTYEELRSVFQWGKASKTDAVLTRQFNPRTGEEQRERLITVYLRKNQTLEDLVLDLAHELTHATAEVNWDPYDPSLSAAKYIWITIEGPGGEVDALVSECQIGNELAFGSGESALRCRRYQKKKGGGIDRELVRRELYRVGPAKRELMRKLGLEAELFPFLSVETPQLFSSTGHAPYPVALLDEYLEITKVACENSRKRLDNLSGRSPAVAMIDSYKETAAHFVARRCE